MTRLQTLLQSYLDNAISETEYHEMWQLLSKDESAELPPELLQELWEKEPQYNLQPARWDSQFKALKEAQHPPVLPIRHRVRHQVVYRYAAIAAAVALLIGIGGAFWHQAESGHHTHPIASRDCHDCHDVTPPTSNKATLTLGNGKTIILDSTGIGSLASEGLANAKKVTEAKLVYAANTTTATISNTLEVPRGGKPMELQLADGSKVWLNTASSITFPNVFTGNERTVSIKGEAYFEVTHNSDKPFIAQVNNMKVEVLGTRFDIKSYADETITKATLLEGKIKVHCGNNAKVLQPEQQANTNNSANNLTILDHIDVEEVTAWKEGNFMFDNCDIYEVMKQMQRWYDVDVEFKTQNIQQHFEGIFSRNVSLSKALEMLSKSGNLKFTVNDRKIIIE